MNMPPRRPTTALRIAGALLACSSAAYIGAQGPVVKVTDSSVQGNEHGLARIHNPYAGDSAAIAAGADLFDDKACSSCHGSEGGGGMCPPLVNDRWVYGSDDTTLFNLIKLGSVGLRAKGYTRGSEEKVAGDMPPLASMVSDDEAWKLIAYVRSKYAGDPAKRNW